ncbi:LysR family transcriptional regulator [Actinoplanes lobatus]|uniref:LysR family transcriptional regulator n=1 Tax=Actinoplanes lobatus TaxID=113568 RepID=UPI00167AC393|nr:LysR family transcriptional regulator [Actinoplanes lobatus]
MEIRDIEIFLTLAEELHFGRTAQRLHVSQARVSQAIKAQERRIGAVLFERTSRVVTLTPVGERLRDDLRAGYDAIQRGIAVAAESARGVSGTVRFGVMGALAYEIRDLIDRFRSDHPGCEVALREIQFADPFTPLRAREVDLALVWRPVREPDLVEGPIVYTEGLLLAVAEGHELAGRESVTLEDFGGRLFLDPGDRAPGYWMESVLPTRTPRGTPIPRGPVVSTFHELMHEVAAGRAIAPVHTHYLHYYAHPGIVLLPVTDAPAAEWVLVWRDGDINPAIRRFADEAARRGPRAFGPIDHPKGS